ncbi:uncharacterized protein METZ01_LOCUS241884 [marine metagenome]|uniref:Uncharacterized protein n=1 Tax=marine metagenome TaxID=408172 RepID=A0A382HP29_9ZZZZ
MKKALGITLITFGLLFVAIFGTSVYMVGSEENSDEWVIEDCERRVSAGEYARWDEEAMDRCIEDGFKTLAGVGAFLIFGIVLGLIGFGILYWGYRLVTRPNVKRYLSHSSRRRN